MKGGKLADSDDLDEHLRSVRFPVSLNDLETYSLSLQFDEAVKAMPELKSILSRAQDDLNPLRTMTLFERIPSEVNDCFTVPCLCFVWPPFECLFLGSCFLLFSVAGL